MLLMKWNVGHVSRGCPKPVNWNIVYYSVHSNSSHIFAKISIKNWNILFGFACMHSYLSVSGRGSRLYLADYLRYILFEIYHPSGLLDVFCQSGENLRDVSKFGQSTEEIWIRTCLHLGNSFNRFLQLDKYHNYTFFRFCTLGGGWGKGGFQIQFKLATEFFSVLFQLLAREMHSNALRSTKYDGLHILRALDYESTWNSFDGNEKERFVVLSVLTFSEDKLGDFHICFVIVLVLRAAIHSVQLILAVASYRPIFLDRKSVV